MTQPDITPASSKMLRYSFGFSKAVWSRVVGVSVKTIHDWERAPTIKLKGTTRRRLFMLQRFHSHVKPEHRLMVGRCAYGSERAPRFARELFNPFGTLSDLIEQYHQTDAYMDYYLANPIPDDRRLKRP